MTIVTHYLLEIQCGIWSEKIFPTLSKLMYFQCFLASSGLSNNVQFTYGECKSRHRRFAVWKNFVLVNWKALFCEIYCFLFKKLTMKHVCLVLVIVFKHQIMPVLGSHTNQKGYVGRKRNITLHLDGFKYILTSMCFFGSTGKWSKWISPCKVICNHFWSLMFLNTVSLHHYSIISCIWYEAVSTRGLWKHSR